MKIQPLPVFEADANPDNRDALTLEEQYAKLKPPKTIVVKFGAMKFVGEYPYQGDASPGCGSKLVIRTHRGTELAEMLTTTCDNAGCGKSVSRQEMLDYIDNSGGKDYPFYTNGKILRLATIEDLNKQSELISQKSNYIKICKALIVQHKLAMTLVEVEPILGQEMLVFYYMSEDRVDFRDLVRELAAEFKTRIDLRQVGARDEARLVADYERCGQHCCCKTFLKVLKPVSMRSAKVQKATLDPLKISGRCGRLMCCLRYEDQTYKDLKKNLPHRRTRVGTTFGPGIVLDTKILVQLALVKLEHNDEEVAIPIEELMDPETCPKPGEHEAKQRAEQMAQQVVDDPMRGMPQKEVEESTDDKKRRKRRRSGKKGSSRTEQQDRYREKSKTEEAKPGDHPQGDRSQDDRPKEDGEKSERKGRRRRRGRGKGPNRSGPAVEARGSDSKGPDSKGPDSSGPRGDSSSTPTSGKKKRRRGGKGRRRRGGGGGEGSGGGGDSGSGPSN